MLFKFENLKKETILYTSRRLENTELKTQSSTNRHVKIYRNANFDVILKY